MTFMKKMSTYLDMFKKGKKLANAETWKKRAVVQNLLVAFGGVILVALQWNGYTVAMDEANLEVLSTILITIIGLINCAVYTATSSKMCINPKEMLQDDTVAPEVIKEAAIDTDTLIYRVKEALIREKYDLTLDGNFDKVTQAALVSFKFHNKLPVNETIDEATLKALGISVAE